MSLAEDHCGQCGRDPCECFQEGSEEGPDDNDLERGGEELGHFIATVEKKTPDRRRLQKRLFIDLADDEDHPRVYTQAAGKRPAHLSHQVEEEEEDSDAPGAPNLAEYFAQFELAPQSVIAMCRTYANCLAATLRAAKSLRKD